MINKKSKLLLPALVLGAAATASVLLNRHPPVAEVKAPDAPTLTVNTIELQASHYQVKLESQGLVEPGRQVTLVSRVPGIVVRMSDRFVVGGRFNDGDELLAIDQTDYVLALTQARASVAQAQAQLQEQQALAAQAMLEWQQLGSGQTPSALTLRKPQVAAAQANLDAAEAQYERAALDLQRTRIYAPFDGFVKSRSVDIGDFVAAGSTVGQVHAATDYLVRLPLVETQLKHLMPVIEVETAPLAVEFSAVIGGDVHRWTGSLERIEGMDADTQQLTVVARIPEPLTASDTPLLVGQYVQALITANELQDVFIISRAALRSDQQVLIVDQQQRVYRRSVNVVFTDDQHVVIDQGLEPGQILVTSPLATVADGTPVVVQSAPGSDVVPVMQQ